MIAIVVSVASTAMSTRRGVADQPATRSATAWAIWLAIAATVPGAKVGATMRRCVRQSSPSALNNPLPSTPDNKRRMTSGR